MYSTFTDKPGKDVNMAVNGSSATEIDCHKGDQSFYCHDKMYTKSKYKVHDLR